MRVIRLALAGTCLLSAPSWVASAGDLAVVVSRENPTEEVSFHELVKIFKLDRQRWAHGPKIFLLMPEAGAAERQVLLQKVYRMNDVQLRGFWLQKVYTEELSSVPKTLGSNEAVKRFLNQVPNAIGVIDASAVDSRIKVLRIDGKLPGDPFYGLAE